MAPCTQLALKQGEGVDARTQLALGGGLVVLLLAGGPVDRLQTGELEEGGGGGPLCSSPACNDYDNDGGVDDDADNMVKAQRLLLICPTCHNELARWISHKIRVWMMNTKRSDVIGQLNRPF